MKLLKDKRFCKFLFPSLLGAFLFVAPIRQGANLTIPIAVAANGLLDLMGEWSLTVIWGLISLSAVITLLHKTVGIGVLKREPKLDQLFGVKGFWFVVRMAGFLLANMIYFDVGPAFIIGEATGALVIHDLLPILVCVFLLAGLLLALLLNYGLLTSDGTAVSNLIIGIFICIIVALILIGGVKRIGKVTEKLVPLMALLYVILGVGLIVLKMDRVPAVFGAIFSGAFQPAAVTGGVVGSFFVSMQKGVSRGIFSNEAGLGTGSIAHACADTNDPAKQGLYGIFEVFMDTIVVCTLTALVILLGSTSIPYGQTAGAELTISGFTNTYGSWVSIFTAVALCCFAFATVLGWGLYGIRCAEFLFGTGAVRVFALLQAAVVVLGAVLETGTVWLLSEIVNGLMAIPNLITLALLSSEVVALTKEYTESDGKAVSGGTYADFHQRKPL